MDKEYGKFNIRIYGTAKEIEKTIEMLDNLNLSDVEYEDRLIIQEGLDDLNLKVDLLYKGNSVYRMKPIVNEAKKLIKSGTLEKMSDSFYKFLILACGSIAHYDKKGWILTYCNDAEELRKFFRKNESDRNVVQEQPRWAADRIRIAKALLEL